MSLEQFGQEELHASALKLVNALRSNIASEAQAAWQAAREAGLTLVEERLCVLEVRLKSVEELDRRVAGLESSISNLCGEVPVPKKTLWKRVVTILGNGANGQRSES